MASSKKNPAAAQLGKLGGRARLKSLSPAERVKIASNAGKAAWANMNIEERSAEMKRRAAKRTRPKK
jgi:hypothetical protein